MLELAPKVFKPCTQCGKADGRCMPASVPACHTLKKGHWDCEARLRHPTAVACSSNYDSRKGSLQNSSSPRSSWRFRSRTGRCITKRLTKSCAPGVEFGSGRGSCRRVVRLDGLRFFTNLPNFDHGGIGRAANRDTVGVHGHQSDGSLPTDVAGCHRVLRACRSTIDGFSIGRVPDAPPLHKGEALLKTKTRLRFYSRNTPGPCGTRTVP